MNVEQIKSIARTGTLIPKPVSKGNYRVKGVGKRRGEDALIYTIPNRNNPRAPYEKGATFSEIKRAHDELHASGKFNRLWFEEYLPDCNAEGGCNFTTIGGLFVLHGEAEYIGNGVYRRVAKRSKQVPKEQ